MNSQMVIIEKLSDEQLKERKVFTWDIWEKEPSIFEWFYDSQEQCFFLQGEVAVHTEQGDFEIGQGDFVTFKKGLKCKWEIKNKVRKHYNFS